MNRNLRLDIEYDGTGCAGWAKQPGLPTIEGLLEEMLGQVLQERVSLSVAGRTDAGVHARGQVVSFLTGNGIEAGRLAWSLNSMLPDEVAIKDCSEAAEDFDARRSALSRLYSYSILNREYKSPFRARFVHHYAGPLDLALMEQAAAMILGNHDFTAFTPTVSEHSYFLRDITLSEWRREDDLLIYRIRSKSFMRNMVRALVGTMLEIGRGYRPLEELEPLLEGAARSEAGETAPARGLCLEAVEYG